MSAQGMDVNFKQKRGQVEIGGKFVGAEFHHSRPLPSRISFFYPVANSIDLSTDYWKRDESRPIQVTVNYNGKSDTVGYTPSIYHYTPFQAKFLENNPDYKITYSYKFGEELPIMVVEMRLKNLTKQETQFKVESKINTTLRTCQTYAFKRNATVEYQQNGSVFKAAFEDADTDSAVVFVANAGLLPNHRSQRAVENYPNPLAVFSYSSNLLPDSEMVIIQIIGSCRQGETDEIISQSLKQWKVDTQKGKNRITAYAFKQSKLKVGVPSLDETTHWAKAVIATNKHYIDGNFVPMPCPAEYNFYFTHDVLLTDLGVVNFDIGRVKQDLLFMKAHSGTDSVLCHAYYWKDDGFKTEFCGTDNWNHLWFIILANSYMKHSADTNTVRQLFPILQKSIRMISKNIEPDGLVYTWRPDWWDIGHIYGARSYVTILTIRALQDFASLKLYLNDTTKVDEYISQANRMKNSLVRNLWNEEKGYLFNMLDSSRIDRHYYSGSLLATVYNILDFQKNSQLLKTAKHELLNPNLGIRNAMPPDFHLLTDVYHFKENEAGSPYVYANGGVWPHGTVWYILGLIANHQIDEAGIALQKFLTLDGIRNSPNGQPSFYEYRNANPRSPDYGKIDKPTFLWAGGWFLNALYQLAGVRENPWNIHLVSQLPQSFQNTEYDLYLLGEKCKIDWTGKGKFVKQLWVDNSPAYSMLLTSPAKSITIHRGMPENPYLEKTDYPVSKVNYTASRRKLRIYFKYVQPSQSNITVISPTSCHSLKSSDQNSLKFHTQEIEKGIYRTVFSGKLEKSCRFVEFQF